MKRESRAPLIIAIVLLLLPVLYVGSYVALVTPRGTVVEWDGFGGVRLFRYRCGGDHAAMFFWPVEQIDRKVRPGAWQADLDFRFSDGDFDFGFQGENLAP